jgi:superoxide dismutase, Cu-Zn family
MRHLICITVIAAFCSGCASTREYQAVMAPTQGQTATGTLKLAPQDDKVLITGQISGLSATTVHGFHVHENGDCSSPDASSAGAHFNPRQQPHGNPADPAHHAGDMLSLGTDGDGKVEVRQELSGVSLGDGGPGDIAGKAIVLHEKADDYSTQPSGNSGGRIACGVIEKASGGS